MILHHLPDGPKRFSVLRRLVAGATQRMLTQQLRELERDGIVSRKVFPVAPPKGEYAFTPYGRTLEPLLEAMKTWSENHRLQESDLIPC